MVFVRFLDGLVVGADVPGVRGRVRGGVGLGLRLQVGMEVRVKDWLHS